MTEMNDVGSMSWLWTIVTNATNNFSSVNLHDCKSALAIFFSLPLEFKIRFSPHCCER